MNSNDTEVKRGIFALFKGDSGAGKSVGALSFPKPYVLDHDRKMPAIARKHFPGKSVEYDTFDDIFQVGEKLERLKESCPYDTIIGDSVTSLAYQCIKSIDEVKGQSILTMLQNVKKSKKGSSTIELRGFDYYNGEDSFLKYYLDSLRTIWDKWGCNIILIAHVLTAETTDITSKVVTKTRRIVTSGKNIAAYIPAQFDEVWHFGVMLPDFDDTINRVKHVVCTEAIGDDNAKTAFNLPAKIDFTGRSLYDEIQHLITQ